MRGGSTSHRRLELFPVAIGLQLCELMLSNWPTALILKLQKVPRSRTSCLERPSPGNCIPCTTFNRRCKRYWKVMKRMNWNLNSSQIQNRSDRAIFLLADSFPQRFEKVFQDEIE